MTGHQNSSRSDSFIEFERNVSPLPPLARAGWEAHKLVRAARRGLVGALDPPEAEQSFDPVDPISSLARGKDAGRLLSLALEDLRVQLRGPARDQALASLEERALHDSHSGFAKLLGNRIRRLVPRRSDGLERWRELAIGSLPPVLQVAIGDKVKAWSASRRPHKSDFQKNEEVDEISRKLARHPEVVFVLEETRSPYYRDVDPADKVESKATRRERRLALRRFRHLRSALGKLGIGSLDHGEHVGRVRSPLRTEETEDPGSHLEESDTVEWLLSLLSEESRRLVEYLMEDNDHEQAGRRLWPDASQAAIRRRAGRLLAKIRGQLETRVRNELSS
ncbi:MAG: hypothetical protein AB7N76_12595 [Planctomycetota bacterium]